MPVDGRIVAPGYRTDVYYDRRAAEGDLTQDRTVPAMACRPSTTEICSASRFQFQWSRLNRTPERPLWNQPNRK